MILHYFAMRTLTTAMTLLFALLIIYNHNTAEAQIPQLQYEPGVLLVKFKEDSIMSEIDDKGIITKLRISNNKVEKMLIDNNLALKRSKLSNIGIHRITFTEDRNIIDIIQEMKKHTEVEIVARNYYRYATATTPNDIYFTNQWYLESLSPQNPSIDAVKAWDIEKGKDSIVIAIIDHGVDFEQSDLQGKYWNNAATGGSGSSECSFFPDGYDNNHNGYIDDCHGFNFTYECPIRTGMIASYCDIDEIDDCDGDGKDNTEDLCPCQAEGDIGIFGCPNGFTDWSNEPYVPYPIKQAQIPAIDHGTAVAAVAAAATNNNNGIAGVCWNCKIMVLRVFEMLSLNYLSYAATDENIINAIEYAASNGAQIVNLSLGGPQIVEDDMFRYIFKKYQYDILFAIATGNDNNNTVHYPAKYSDYYDNVIAVGASCEHGGRCGNLDWQGMGSNYGNLQMVVAPGNNIYSIEQSSNTYKFFRGTSFATPIVSGIAGLIYSKNPNLTPNQVRYLLELTADGVNGITAFNAETGWGKVNAYRALNPIISIIVGDGTSNYTFKAVDDGTFIVPENLLRIEINLPEKDGLSISRDRFGVEVDIIGDYGSKPLVAKLNYSDLKEGNNTVEWSGYGNQGIYKNKRVPEGKYKMYFKDKYVGQVIDKEVTIIHIPGTPYGLPSNNYKLSVQDLEEGGKLKLEWAALNADAAYGGVDYRIYRKDPGGTDYLPVATTSATEYTDTILKDNQEYCYKVSAYYKNRPHSESILRATGECGTPTILLDPSVQQQSYTLPNSVNCDNSWNTVAISWDLTPIRNPVTPDPYLLWYLFGDRDISKVVSDYSYCSWQYPQSFQPEDCDQNENFAPVPGIAYWVHSNQKNDSITFRANASPADPAVEGIHVGLFREGAGSIWNMFGNPFSTAVAWSEVEYCDAHFSVDVNGSIIISETRNCIPFENAVGTGGLSQLFASKTDSNCVESYEIITSSTDFRPGVGYMLSTYNLALDPEWMKTIYFRNPNYSGHGAPRLSLTRALTKWDKPVTSQPAGEQPTILSFEKADTEPENPAAGSNIVVNVFAEDSKFVKAAFKVEYDPTFAKPINPVTNTVVTNDETVYFELEKQSGCTTAMASMRNAEFRVLIVCSGRELNGKNLIGKLPFRLMPSVDGRAGRISVVPDDPKLLMLTDMGDALKKKDIDLRPRTIIEAGFSGDTTPPIIEIEAPCASPDCVVASEKPEIRAIVSDTVSFVDFDQVVVKIDDIPATLQIDRINGVVTCRPSENLNQGLHTVTIFAKDYFSNSASAQSTFIVDTIPLDISFETAAAAISPNGDGRNDSVSVGFNMSEPGTVRAEIVDINTQRIVRVLMEHTYLPTGYHSLPEWDGKDDSETTVNEGEYELAISGAAVADQIPVSRSFPTIVDLSAPEWLSNTPAVLIGLRKPKIAVSITDTFSGIDFEASSLSIDGGAPVAFDGYTGTLESTETAVLYFVPKTNLENGEHTVTASISDAAGNTAESSWTFSVFYIDPENIEYVFDGNLMFFEIPSELGISQGQLLSDELTRKLHLLANVILDRETINSTVEEGELKDVVVSCTIGGKPADVDFWGLTERERGGAGRIVQPPNCPFKFDIIEIDHPTDVCPASNPDPKCLTRQEAEYVESVLTTYCSQINDITGGPLVLVPMPQKINVVKTYTSAGVAGLGYIAIPPSSLNGNDPSIIIHELTHIFNGDVLSNPLEESTAKYFEQYLPSINSGNWITWGTANNCAQMKDEIRMIDYRRPSASHWQSVLPNVNYYGAPILDSIRIMDPANGIRNLYQLFRNYISSNEFSEYSFRDYCREFYPSGIEGLSCDRWAATLYYFHKADRYNKGTYIQDNVFILKDKSRGEIGVMPVYEYSAVKNTGGYFVDNINISVYDWNGTKIQSTTTNEVAQGEFNYKTVAGKGRVKIVASSSEDSTDYDVKYIYNHIDILEGRTGVVHGVITNRNDGTVVLSCLPEIPSVTESVINGGFMFFSKYEQLLNYQGQCTLEYIPLGQTMPTTTKTFIKSAKADIFNNNYLLDNTHYVQMTDMSLVNITQQTLTQKRNGLVVNLSWTSAPTTELAAFNDFIGYRVYRNETSIQGDDWGYPRAYYPLPSEQTSYTDILEQDELNKAYYYRVTAVDANGNEVIVTNAVLSDPVGDLTEFVVLDTGIHLLGFNRNPGLGQEDIMSYLSQLNDFNNVDYYDIYDGNGIEIENPSTALIAAGKAYWIEVKNVGRILLPALTGTIINDNNTEQVVIPLSHGWNLVANPFYYNPGSDTERSTLLFDDRHKIRKDGADKAITNAMQEDLIASNFYGFSGNVKIFPKFHQSGQILSPSDAIAIYNKQNCTQCSLVLSGNSVSPNPIGQFIHPRKHLINITPLKVNRNGQLDANTLRGTFMLDIIQPSESFPASTDQYDIYDGPPLPMFYSNQHMIRSVHNQSENGYDTAPYLSFSKESISDLSPNSRRDLHLKLDYNASYIDSFYLRFSKVSGDPYRYFLSDTARTDANGDVLTDELFDGKHGAMCRANNDCIIRASLTAGKGKDRSLVLSIVNGTPPPSEDHLYAGVVKLDGRPADENTGITAVFKDSQGAVIGSPAQTNSTGGFVFYSQEAPASVELKKDAYIIETAPVPAPGSDYLVSLDLKSVLDKCDGEACLRGGNMSYEGPDEKKISLRLATGDKVASYRDQYNSVIDSDILPDNYYFYDMDYLKMHFGERAIGSELLWDSSSEQADINKDGRVDWKDAAFVSQTLGCNRTTCGELCVSKAGFPRCGVHDPNCYASACVMRGGVPMSWKNTDFYDTDDKISASEIAGFKACVGVSTPECLNKYDFNDDNKVDGETGDYGSDFNVYKKYFDCTTVKCSTRCLVDTLDTTARMSVDKPEGQKYSCLTSQGYPVPWTAADMNGDGKVDESDLTFVQSRHGHGVKWSAEHEKADFNGDGVVDLKDLYYFKRMFSKTVTNNCIVDTDRCPAQAAFDPALPGNEQIARNCCHTKHTDPERYIIESEMDMNGDGRVTIHDLAGIKPYYALGWGPSARRDVLRHDLSGLHRVDYNMDGKVTIKDLKYLKSGLTRCWEKQNNPHGGCTVCDDIPLGDIDDCVQ